MSEINYDKCREYNDMYLHRIRFKILSGFKYAITQMKKKHHDESIGLQKLLAESTHTEFFNHIDILDEVRGIRHMRDIVFEENYSDDYDGSSDSFLKSVYSKTIDMLMDNYLNYVQSLFLLHFTDLFMIAVNFMLTEDYQTVVDESIFKKSPTKQHDQSDSSYNKRNILDERSPISSYNSYNSTSRQEDMIHPSYRSTPTPTLSRPNYGFDLPHYSHDNDITSEAGPTRPPPTRKEYSSGNRISINNPNT